MAEKTKRREVEKHRQCPCCYSGEFNGVGTAYTTRMQKTYYKCDMCSHTWVVRKSKESTVVESTTRTVEEPPTNGKIESHDKPDKPRGNQSASRTRHSKKGGNR